MPGEQLTRVNFWDVFKLGQNDSLITKVPILVGTNLFEEGTIVQKGATLGGVDFHTRLGWDIAAVIKDQTYVLRGLYVPESS